MHLRKHSSPQSLKIHRKHKSEFKLPRLQLPKAQSLPIKQNIDYHESEYKEDFLKLQSALKQLRSIKKIVLKENNRLLLKKIVEELRYSMMGRVVVKFWEDPTIIINYSEQQMKSYQKQNNFQLDFNLIRAVQRATKTCQVNLGQFKSQIWKKQSHEVDINRKKLQSEIVHVGDNIGKISKKEERRQMIDCIKNIHGEIIAKRYFYTEWRQRAVKFLEQGDIKCQVLKAELSAEKKVY